MTKAQRTPSQRPVTPSEAAWIRGMTQRRFSRRDLLRYTGTGAAGLGAAWMLAACGSSGQSLPTAVASLPGKAGTVKVANTRAHPPTNHRMRVLQDMGFPQSIALRGGWTQGSVRHRRASRRVAALRSMSATSNPSLP